jgi:predicted ferric reductase
MQSTLKQALLFTSYIGIIFLPTLLGYLLGLFSGLESPLYLFGRIAALVGFPILAMQPVLAARLPFLKRIYGINRVMQFHKRAAVTAGILILLHPLFLSAGLSWWGLLYSFDLPWFYLLGKAALFALFLIILTSLGQKLLGISWKLWKQSHNTLALLIVLGGFIHSILSGSSLTALPLLILWSIYLAFGFAAQAYRKLVVPGKLAK